MAEQVSSSAWRVYFIVSSDKEGGVALGVDHRRHRQHLSLLIRPENTIPHALTFLTLPFAHYVRQRERIMVPDPDVRDARGFFVEGSELPVPIWQPGREDELYDAVYPHISEEWRRFFGKERIPIIREKAEETGLLPDFLDPMPSSNERICVPAAEVGVVPYSG